MISEKVANAKDEVANHPRSKQRGQQSSRLLHAVHQLRDALRVWRIGDDALANGRCWGPIRRLGRRAGAARPYSGRRDGRRALASPANQVVVPLLDLEELGAVLVEQRVLVFTAILTEGVEQSALGVVRLESGRWKTLVRRTIGGGHILRK